MSNDKGRLVLSRRLDEEIVVHEKGRELLRFKISGLTKGQVRIAFQADPSIQINRSEIFSNEDI